MGLEPASSPPPPNPHCRPTKARVVPEQTPGEQHARQRSQREEGGEHARGQGNAPPSPDPSQEWRGTTPRPLSQNWRGTTTHNPHTNTKPPTQGRRGEAGQPNAPPTHHTRTRAHTTHTTTTTTAATNTSTTITQSTQKREHRPQHKHTQHRKPPQPHPKKPTTLGQEW